MRAVSEVLMRRLLIRVGLVRTLSCSHTARGQVRRSILSNRGNGVVALLAGGLCKKLRCLEVIDGNSRRKLNWTGCFHLARLLQEVVYKCQSSALVELSFTESEKSCKISLNQPIQRWKGQAGERIHLIYSFPLCLCLLGSHLFQEVCKESRWGWIAKRVTISAVLVVKPPDLGSHFPLDHGCPKSHSISSAAHAK